MESVTKSSVVILCLQLLLLIHQTECQFRIPPITTTVFRYTVYEPQSDALSGQEVTVPDGQEFTIQIHLDQAPTEDDYDIFVSECSANGIPFMDNYGCIIKSRSAISVSMTRDMLVIPKDDPRLTQTKSYKNDKFVFIYLRPTLGGVGRSLQIVCSVKYVSCQDMTCHRQQGCTNYMSSNSLNSIQTTSAYASVHIEGGGVGGENVGGNGILFPPGQPQLGPATTPFSQSGNRFDVSTANIAWWHIALICLVALLLFIAVIALLIILCCRKKEADSTTTPRRPARNSTQRPDTRIYEEVYEPKHYYTPSENVSHTTYAPTNASVSRVALAAYNRPG